MTTNRDKYKIGYDSGYSDGLKSGLLIGATTIIGIIATGTVVGIAVSAVITYL